MVEYSAQEVFLASGLEDPGELSEIVDVCAACGQSMLASPDDPRSTLFCDVCLGGCR